MRKVMIIAGEASGDTLGAELVKALRARPGFAGAEFFGAGGPKLAAAGVEIAIDMMKDSVIGVSDAISKGLVFWRRLKELKQLALQQRPDLIALVDFSYFNHKLARALRGAANEVGWSPKIVKYVSPQVWASRAGRANEMPRDFDLLLSIFPFEKSWYRQRVPNFRVEFVGHPMIDRYAAQSFQRGAGTEVLLLPGSRRRELRNHLPVLVEAVRQMRQSAEFRCRMVLPSQELKELAETIAPLDGIVTQVEGLPERLAQATIALASSGTVTMECAYFRVPTVVLYKSSWSTYQVGKRIVKVKYLAMPNLLANEEIFPEFIQHEANGQNLARAALELLNNEARRRVIQTKLDAVIASLGDVGASQRAAAYIEELALGQKEPIMQAKS
jgi:lipid-A-disaccharide synthase